MRTAGLAAILMVATSLHAARFDIVRRGEPVSGAEVCVFAAPGADTLLTRFFGDRGVRCAPADAEVELGPGWWNVFAKRGNDLVSERVELVDSTAQRVKLELVEAAAMGLGSWNYVWVPRTASAFPLYANALVPAGRVIPLVVGDMGIRFVGPSMTLVAGELRKLEEPSRPDKLVDAVVPVLFQSVPEDSSDPPMIEVIDYGGHSYRPEAMLERKDVETRQALLFYRNIRFSQLTTRVRGERWKSSDTSFDRLNLDIAVVPREPVVVRPSTKVAVHWWTAQDLRALADTQRLCRRESERDRERISEFSAKLLFCGDDYRKMNSYVSSRQCKEVASRSLSPFVNRGDAIFEDVAAGVYFVKIGMPRLPSLEKRVEIGARGINDLDFELHWFTFYGRVTIHDEPVMAEIYGTASDRTGRYEAVLARDPKTNPETILSCDGAIRYTIVPDYGPVENSAFDVDIAQNRIVVEVVEAGTEKPIRDAQVSMSATFNDEPEAAHFAGPAGKTDIEGRLVIEPVLTNKNIAICASTPDHDGKCADTFQMGEQKLRIVHIPLLRSVKRAWRIVSPYPIANGEVVWVTRDGRISEIVRDIDTEGGFISKVIHGPDETLSFGAPAHPLFVASHAAFMDGGEIVVPQAPRRTIEIALDSAERENAWVALRIGQSVATINVIGWHQMRRRMQGVLAPGHVATIPDVLVTGPVRVILVPFSVMAAHPNVELPMIPEMGSLPQQDLGDRGAVTFGGRTPRAITAPPASTSSR